MIQRIALLFTAFIFTGLAFAQPPGGGKEERREKIKAQKIAFISTELSLTTEEAEKFWPVYNAYEAELETLHEERRKYRRELRKTENLDDDRAYELFELLFKTEKKESEVRQTYLKKFADVLGKGKAAKVFIAEEKFRRLLIDKLKSDRRGPPPDDRP
jgi:Spy/CpxP family protein refolding chaperone